MVWTAPTESGVRPALGFLVRRVFRVVPLYWLVTLVWVYTVSHAGWPQLRQSMLFYPLDVSMPLVFGFPALFVGWTLNYEMYFYLVLAFALLLERSRWVVMALYALATLLVLPLWLGVGPNLQPFAPVAGYPFRYLALMTNPIVWEFVFGCLSAWWVRWVANRVTSTQALGLAGMGALLFLILYFSLDAKMEPLACGIPAMVLVSTWALADVKQVWQVPAGWTVPGDWSYAIYLVHPVIERALKPFRVEGQTHLELLHALAVLAFVLLCAKLLHQHVELPMQAVGRRLAARLAVNDVAGAMEPAVASRRNG
jgi:peptidoglycan/LPS O-acetylase OafA/YrhL